MLQAGDAARNPQNTMSTAAKPEDQPSGARLAVSLVCPRDRTKAIKDLAKAAGLLDRVEATPNGSHIILVPAATVVGDDETVEDSHHHSVSALRNFGPPFEDLADALVDERDVRVYIEKSSASFSDGSTLSPATTEPSLPRRALADLEGLPSELLDFLPSRWEKYDDFVLFPRGAFSHETWARLDRSTFDEAMGRLAREFRVTRMAAKGAIVMDDPARSPRITPLFGTFRGGSGLDDVFWTSTAFTTPHGLIRYTWAPSETMYSRGNASEKLRIADLDTVNGATVVDLYCGIGYFTFGEYRLICATPLAFIHLQSPMTAYFLAGARKVIACDISPFAIEAISRGAKLNGVGCSRLDNPSPGVTNPVPSPDDRKELLLFHGDNASALPYYIGSATHVNMGLLPTCRASVSLALQALDPALTGWLHFHEEVLVLGSAEDRREHGRQWAAEVVESVKRDEHVCGREVRLEALHKVKQMAATVDHLVAQVRVSPRLT